MVEVQSIWDSLVSTVGNTRVPHRVASRSWIGPKNGRARRARRPLSDAAVDGTRRPSNETLSTFFCHDPGKSKGLIGTGRIPFPRNRAVGCIGSRSILKEGPYGKSSLADLEADRPVGTGSSRPLRTMHHRPREPLGSAANFENLRVRPG